VLRLLILVPAGYILAVIAASALIIVGTFGPVGPDTYDFTIPLIFATGTVGAASFALAAVAILLSEVFGLRSIFYFLAVGGALGLILNQLLDFHASAALLDRAHVLFPAAGFVGGIVYWLVAGRLAGAMEAAHPGAHPSGPAL
jgi:hypothetical protein